MARTYGQVFCAIWDDEEFCSLSSHAQRAYLMLVTKKDISACGLFALTLRRWAFTLPEAERATLVPALHELAEHRYVVIDEDTEELLVRTFVRHDGGYKHAKRKLAVLAAAGMIRSKALRAAMVTEFASLSIEIPDGMATDCQPIGNPVANTEPIGSGWLVVTEVSIDVLEPESRIQEPESVSEVAPRRADVERLCELLADLIESNESKRPTVTAKWRDACRLLLDRDGRTEQQVENAIRWCQTDEFWRSNVLSMPKLREKYDQLRLAAARASPAAKPSTSDINALNTQRLAAKYEAYEKGIAQ